ncbi:MAG TPA: hypothetical protein DDZ89_16460, partial [Clostridiales bacterium]|nr:hypothetical protein [Clostridiales bacterium]
MNQHFNELRGIVGDSYISTRVPLKQYTSFRIGGPADIIVFPPNIELLKKVVSYLSQNQVTRLLIGNGTNLLVSDQGFRGVVVHTGKNLKTIQVQEDEKCIYAQCGALLSAIAAAALKNNLGGFEFASGIPGTLGGALFMNAGAYGSTMSDVAVSTTALDAQCNEVTVNGADHDFGYRSSCFRKNNLFILESKLQLYSCDYDTIKEKMRDLNMKRKSSQPLEYPSAGSVFKRPVGYFAGKLIEDSGLKGCKKGGACVSEKHAGFIINSGDATAQDVDELINHIISEVYNRFS